MSICGSLAKWLDLT